MSLVTLKHPINRLGFVLFCISLAACFIAFAVTYRTSYQWGIMWIGHLLMESGGQWQQSIFKLGFVGALVGATLAWNWLRGLRRIAAWVSQGEKN